VSDERATSYAEAGVDLDQAERAMAKIGDAVRATYDDRVLAGIGAFGGLFAHRGSADDVLVASTDGVGTKTMLAAASGRLRGVGSDLVHHCINDILVQGAEPLFFLDYVAASTLIPDRVADLVGGVADACLAAGIPLLGGETAEMPGVYREGEFDLVGTIVGHVRRPDLITGAEVRHGDRLLGIASGGLQTNGFSLARAALGDRLDAPLEGGTVLDALLAPHRSFLAAVRPLLAAGLVRAMAHITGGGLPGNLPRSLPEGLGARLEPGRWREPAVFGALRAAGVPEPEMRATFNLGLGYVIACAPERVSEAQAICPEPLIEIGGVVPGTGVVFA
jgi:phosphoribosylformylglycinamidine cyclo-ligase